MQLKLTDVDICFYSCVSYTRMVDDFESQEVRSSGELWSEICSSLPEVRAEATPENNTEFKDSFQPAAQVGVQVNGQSNGTHNVTSSSGDKWEPMEDSEIYIASLGTGLPPAPFCPSHYCRPHVTFSSPCLLSSWSYIYLHQVVWTVGMIGFQSPSHWNTTLLHVLFPKYFQLFCFLQGCLRFPHM